jgi:hypothetical protein
VSSTELQFSEKKVYYHNKMLLLLHNKPNNQLNSHKFNNNHLNNNQLNSNHLNNNQLNNSHKFNNQSNVQFNQSLDLYNNTLTNTVEFIPLVQTENLFMLHQFNNLKFNKLKFKTMNQHFTQKLKLNKKHFILNPQINHLLQQLVLHQLILELLLFHLKTFHFLLWLLRIHQIHHE